jgi:hypothetical protein
MNKIIVYKSKSEYLNELRQDLEPRRLRIVKHLDFIRGISDPKEFEGSIEGDYYSIRENHKMLRRSSPVLDAHVTETEANRLEITYKFNIDREILFSNVMFLLLVIILLSGTNMPLVTLMIFLLILVGWQFLSFWFGLVASKDKYIHFISRTSAIARQTEQ